MTDDSLTQVMFAQQSAINESSRLCLDWLDAIASHLDGKTLTVNGRSCTMHKVGNAVVAESGESQIMLDVRQPSDNLDHIEFTLTKTGWGMCLNEMRTRPTDAKSHE